MASDIPTDVVETHERRRGRTIIDLKRQRDGEWIATQYEVDVVGTGETAPRAVIDYCRQLAEDTDDADA